MVRMSVYYPNQEGTHFDLAYYAGPHRQLVESRLEPLGLRALEIERGVAGYGGAAAPYTVVGHLLFDSLESLGAAWGAKGDDLVADMPNFTNAQPLVQISEVVPR